jgi:hypothetical protein
MKRLLEKLEGKLSRAPEPWAFIVIVVSAIAACYAVITIIALTIESNLWQMPLGIALYFIGKAFYIVFFTKH